MSDRGITILPALFLLTTLTLLAIPTFRALQRTTSDLHIRRQEENRRLQQRRDVAIGLGIVTAVSKNLHATSQGDFSLLFQNAKLPTFRWNNSSAHNWLCPDTAANSKWRAERCNALVDNIDYYRGNLVLEDGATFGTTGRIMVEGEFVIGGVLALPKKSVLEIVAAGDILIKGKVSVPPSSSLLLHSTLGTLKITDQGSISGEFCLIDDNQLGIRLEALGGITMNNENVGYVLGCNLTRDPNYWSQSKLVGRIETTP